MNTHAGAPEGMAVIPPGSPTSGTPGAPGSTGGMTPSPGKPTAVVLRVSCKRTSVHNHAGYRCVVRDVKGHVKQRCSGRSRRKTKARCLALARKRVHAGVLGGAVAHAAGLYNEGFLSTTMSSVGRIVIEFPGGAYSKCSGTVVSRTLVLTAGHCIAPHNGSGPTAIAFLPGATWTSSEEPLDYYKPFGGWSAGYAQWWTTTAFLNGDGARDWALIEIPPEGGHYISDYTGAWSILPNISYGTGAHIYAVGYPASGYWATADGHEGRGQYACNSTWDGRWGSIGSGWELFLACAMNRGASGGPWFTELNNGTWVVGGMTNRCQPNPGDTATSYCDPYTEFGRSSYIDSHFVELWEDVQAKLAYR
jgi:hypothetical protein